MKITPITPAHRSSAYDRERHQMTLEQRIELCKKRRSTYPVDHCQVPAIDAQIKRLEVLLDKDNKNAV